MNDHNESLQMSYLPHTDAERAAMLETIGVTSLEALFAELPNGGRFPRLTLPAPQSEMEVTRRLRHLAGRNIDCEAHPCFLGAGAYKHFRPATVDYVLSRGEFYTAYTPYQPEASQGMLQAMFEYQTMICRLTAMDVSNASHYDGATALAEAVLLAVDHGRQRRRVVVSPGVHPQYRQVVRTYLGLGDVELCGGDDMTTATAALREQLDAQTAAVVIQNPNFLGQFEDVRGLADAVHAVGALLIVVVDPVSLGLFQAPGEHGADVVVADGQPLGLPLSFGGPHLGIFACRRTHVRRLAGRLVGETVDAAGKRGYVLTLGTREQHIRRAKATSNICTNSALAALATAVHLATLGKSGLRRVAELCYHKSHYCAGKLAAIPRVDVNPHAPEGDFFKEFVLRLPCPVDEVNARLLDDFGLIGGHDLGRDDPALAHHMLVAVTEVITRAEIDRFVEGVAAAVR